MKKSLILLAGAVFMLTGALSLTSCGGEKDSTQTSSKSGIKVTISGASTMEVGEQLTLIINLENDSNRMGYSVTSSDETVATVTNGGIVTALKEGSVTITVTSREDETAKATHSITVNASTQPTLKINASADTMKLGSTLTLSAEVTNANNANILYEWSLKNGRGSFMGGTEGSSATYRPLTECSETIVLNAYVGQYRLKAEFKIFVDADITGWTAISTKDELLDLVYGVSSQTANYYLANDIDMEGMYVESGSKNEDATTFKGKLDGRGHAIKNYKIQGVSDGNAYNNGSLFHKLAKGAALRNLVIEAEMDQMGSGWGSSALVGTGVAGCIIDNCLINVNHSYNNGENSDSNGWFAFNAAVIGTGAAEIYDTVVNILDTVEGGKDTIYADYGYPNRDTKIAKNFYTNATQIGGQGWEWGDAVTDFNGYNPGVAFDLKTKDFYDLNEHAWNLVDNQMPTLKVLD
ncbi:MAG: Ig-like domain-containing protein [Erysipelotrichales bacterium]|nr:Ig-like domain-containing protein [Erysipelotrichales bacterium]